MDLLSSFATAVANRIVDRIGTLLTSMRCGIVYELRKEISALEERVMGKLDEVRDVLSRIDAATDQIASELKADAEKLASGDLTPTEEAEVIERLRAHATRLEGLAKDPANPVPDVPASDAPPVPPEENPA